MFAMRAGKFFCEVGLLIFNKCSQLLTSSRLWKKDKMLLREMMCVCVWNGFLLDEAKKNMFFADFVQKNLVIYFGSAHSPVPCCV